MQRHHGDERLQHSPGDLRFILTGIPGACLCRQPGVDGNRQPLRTVVDVQLQPFGLRPLMEQAVAGLIRGDAQVIQRAGVQILEDRHAAQRQAQHQRILLAAGNAQGDFRLAHADSSR